MAKENKCQNPECQKEIPEGKKYCNQQCLERHLQIKKEFKKKLYIEFDAKDDNIWLGQERRKRAFEIILKLAKEYLPMSYDQFASLLSYRIGISLRKITDDYLHVLQQIGLLKREGNSLFLSEGET